MTVTSSPRERLLAARHRLVDLGASVDGFVPDNELHIEVLAAEEERRAILLVELRPVVARAEELAERHHRGRGTCAR